ncbi:MAG TPA: TonB-dependent receptor [Flavisolibacter sp.]
MRRLLCVMLGMLVICSQLLAQNRTISGKVTDEKGNPVIGASVLIKGTGNGTSTNEAGEFSFVTDQASPVLVISAIGYGTTEIKAGTTAVAVALKPQDQNLAEVVVVGYGTQKRNTTSGSIATIKGKTFDQVPVASFDNILQGKATGVQVTGVNGQPGANAYIRIRGVGSLTAGQQPLVVVDGVPTENLNLINPNDIADVSILKDAASASIYGSRGSNGVILVTTKKGRANKPQVSYRFQVGQKSKTPDHFELMNAQEKLQYENDIQYTNDYVASVMAAKGYGNDVTTLTDAQRKEVWDEVLKNQVNWKDLIFRNANLQSHELVLSGGAQGITYYFSGNYYKEQGIVVGSDYRRISSHLNVEYKPYNWIKVGTDMNVASAKDNVIRDRYNAQNPVFASYAYNAYEPPKNDDGTWNYTSQGFNILEAIENNPENNHRLGALGNVFLEITPVKQLTIRSQGGLNYVNYQREYFIKPGSILDQYVGDPTARGSKTDNGSNDLTRIWTNTATWNQTVNNAHNINILVGSEFNDDDLKSYSFSSKGFPTPDVTTQNNGSTPTAATSAESGWSLFSLFGRGRYNFQEKYFVEGTYRRDGSSRFGANKKYGNFWSTGVAWDISKEQFFSVNALNSLKLRASVGTTGNFNIGNYQSYGLYQYVSYNGQTASIPLQVANPDLTWEKNFNYDFGVDVGAFKNRLTATVEYFSRKTSGLLADVPKSLTTGIASRIENVGEMKNHGIEATVGYDVIRNKNVTWNVTGMVTYQKNEITKLYNGTDELFVGYYTKYKVGLPQNVFFLNRWAGVDEQTGVPLYYDKAGKVTKTFSSDDAVEIGRKSPDPTYYGSLSNSVSYRNFALNAELYYSIGGYTYNQVWADLVSDGAGYYQNQAKEALNYWKNPGDKAPNPNPIAANYTVQSTDRFLESTNFLRLRNVSLSYTTPIQIKTFKLQGVRVYVQGQNLVTLTKFHGDPEVGIGSTEQTYNRPGEYTLYTYPQTKAITFGVDVNF